MATLGPDAVSRRPRENVQRQPSVGGFSQKTEIGKGSFAIVYRAVHTVCYDDLPFSLCQPFP